MTAQVSKTSYEATAPNVFGPQAISLATVGASLAMVGMLSEARPLQVFAIAWVVAIGCGYLVRTRQFALACGIVSGALVLAMALGADWYWNVWRPVPDNRAQLEFNLLRLVSENPSELTAMFADANADGVVRRWELEDIRRAVVYPPATVLSPWATAELSNTLSTDD